MAKRNKKKPKMSRWATLQELTWEQWFGRWLTASLVMKAFEKTGKVPKKFRIRAGDNCIVNQPDGSGLLYYEATF